MPATPVVLGRVTGSVGLRHLVLAVLGLAVVVVGLTLAGDFRASQLAAMAYLGIAAGGLTILTGLNGQLSLGHGAFMAIGAYTAALLLGVDSPLPIGLVLLASGAVAVVVGFVVGLAAARLHGPYIAGATLALAIAVPGLAIFWGGTLGGEQGSPWTSRTCRRGSRTPSSSSPRPTPRPAGTSPTWPG